MTVSTSTSPSKNNNNNSKQTHTLAYGLVTLSHHQYKILRLVLYVSIIYAAGITSALFV